MKTPLKEKNQLKKFRRTLFTKKKHFAPVHQTDSFVVLHCRHVNIQHILENTHGYHTLTFYHLSALPKHEYSSDSPVSTNILLFLPYSMNTRIKSNPVQ